MFCRLLKEILFYKECNIEVRGHVKRNYNKKNKVSYIERLKKLRLTTLLERIKVDGIEAFEIINRISNYGRHFNISPLTGNLLSRQISKAKSTNQLYFFGIRVMLF